MADESIVIEIKDSIDSGIAAKIKLIGDNATTAQVGVDGLQASLKTLDGSKLKSIGTDGNTAANGLSKIALANEKLAQAEQKTATATAMAQAAISKAATATALGAAASDKAALAALRLSEAQQKVADRLQGLSIAATEAANSQKAIADAASRGAQIEADYAAMMQRATAATEQNTASINNNAASLGRFSNINDAIASSTANATNATKIQTSEVAKLLGQIDPTVAALDRLDQQEQKLMQFKKIGAIDGDTFNQYKKQLDDTRKGFDGVAKSADKSAFSTVGAKRELIVLGHEAMTGNFSKMPGSFLVLAERMHMTEALFSPMNIGIAALVVSFVAFAYAVGKAESELRLLNGLAAQFSATGRDDIDKSFIVELRKELQLLPGISKSTASEVIAQFANIRDIASSNLKPAAAVVVDLATALGTDAPKAAKILADALYDPIKGAQALDKQLGFLTISNFKTIKSLSDVGKTAEAQKFLIDKLTDAISGLNERSLTPMQKATSDLGNAWHHLMGEISESGPIKSANNLFVGILETITNLLDKLSSYKPPAWLQSMFTGGLNGMVADLFKGNKDSTGGATGSWEAPKGPQYGQTTKYKTDAAGITGSHKTDKTEENRATALAKINAQLDNQIKLMQLLGPESEKQQQFDSIEEGLIGRKIILNDKETASIKAKIAAIVDGALLQSETNRIYEEATGPLKSYNAQLQAAENLLKSGAINESEYNKQRLLAFNAYEKIIAPLNTYIEALNNEHSLLKFVGDELDLETKLQNINNEALQRGTAYTRTQLKEIENLIIKNQEAARVQSALGAIYDQTQGSLKRNTAEITALNLAQSKGLITGEAYSVKLNQLGVDSANIRLQMGSTNPFDALISSLGKLNSTYQGVFSGLTTTYTSFLSTFEDGFANSIGRAIVYSDNLGEALHNVAQSALSELISGLVKLGIQYATNALLGDTIAATSIATQTGISTAAAAATAVAWAPAATMVSLASFGANSAPAIAGITATSTLSSSLALASLAGFKEGGYTGTGGASDIAGFVHGQEYVFDAASTSRIGVSNLQALQDGSTSVAANSRVPTGSQAATNGSTSQQPQNNIRVVNVLDPALIGDFLATPAGEQVFMNTIRKNSSGIKQTIQNG